MWYCCFSYCCSSSGFLQETKHHRVTCQPNLNIYIYKPSHTHIQTVLRQYLHVNILVKYKVLPLTIWINYDKLLQINKFGMEVVNVKSVVNSIRLWWPTYPGKMWVKVLFYNSFARYFQFKMFCLYLYFLLCVMCCFMVIGSCVYLYLNHFFLCTN